MSVYSIHWRCICLFTFLDKINHNSSTNNLGERDAAGGVWTLNPPMVEWVYDAYHLVVTPFAHLFSVSGVKQKMGLGVGLDLEWERAFQKMWFIYWVTDIWST